ncbi:MAG: PhzF family phenazine biosynthesis protein [Acidobacteriota bacterium]|nr:PhzF family phenazine biosynthesis protein [Acidobacteriota bacterium]MDH3522055.1 PhzF family phenazine biosynthesis protein [Acidobacteriota bacterium]
MTEIFQVDAFTERPFAGNPAAVCPLAGPAGERWMQDVAREMNLSETAFFWPEGEALRLRWFTPGGEVELCGHATLATAHVLWETGRLEPAAPASFATLSGRLGAHRDGDFVVLDFPALPGEPVPAPAGLVEALGASPAAVSRARFDLLVELASAAAVRALAPDFRALAALDCRGVAVTAPGDDGEHDFVSRFFAPRYGIDEDPVTGSAHCQLAPYWAPRLGKERMLAYQASARGGVVRVAVRGDRVELAGRAVTVLRGRLAAAAAGPAS